MTPEEKLGDKLYEDIYGIEEVQKHGTINDKGEVYWYGIGYQTAEGWFYNSKISDYKEFIMPTLSNNVNDYHNENDMHMIKAAFENQVRENNLNLIEDPEIEPWEKVQTLINLDGEKGRNTIIQLHDGVKDLAAEKGYDNEDEGLLNIVAKLYKDTQSQDENFFEKESIEKYSRIALKSYEIEFEKHQGVTPAEYYKGFKKKEFQFKKIEKKKTGRITNGIRKY